MRNDIGRMHAVNSISCPAVLAMLLVFVQFKFGDKFSGSMAMGITFLGIGLVGGIVGIVYATLAEKHGYVGGLASIGKVVSGITACVGILSMINVML